MTPTMPPAGEVLPLVRTLQRLPDPLALYSALSDRGRASDTLLFESLDATTKAAERSFVFPRCALRAECRSRAVTVEALSPGGRRALGPIAAWLGERAQVTRSGDALTAGYPPPPTQASEDERLRAPSPFDAVRALATRWVLSARPTSPTLVTPVVFSYDLLECFETLPGGQEDPILYPDFLVWLPEAFLILDHKRRTTTIVVLVVGGEGAETSYNDATAAIQRLTEAVEAAPAPDTIEAAYESDVQTVPRSKREQSGGAAPDLRADCDTSDAAFAGLVSDLKQRIVTGDVFQIVPSRTFSAPCPDPLDTYARLRLLNPSPYMFYVRSSEHTLFGASPETCVKVSGSPRTVEIRPIAGTARRGRSSDGSLDLDLDSRLEAELRLNEKELAEHMMLVDLARNDVARVCEPGSRHVPRLLTVDRYSHVMHLVSYVEGLLQSGLDALHAYAASMNMGTLVGAPKLEAAQILRRREATRRGPYGGAVGYLTQTGDMDTAIVIRSAVVKDQTAYVRAGAGVVYDSDPEAEARETSSKAAAVLKALGATP